MDKRAYLLLWVQPPQSHGGKTPRPVSEDWACMHACVYMWVWYLSVSRIFVVCACDHRAFDHELCVCEIECAWELSECIWTYVCLCEQVWVYVHVCVFEHVCVSACDNWHWVVCVECAYMGVHAWVHACLSMHEHERGAWVCMCEFVQCILHIYDVCECQCTWVMCVMCECGRVFCEYAKDNPASPWARIQAESDMCMPAFKVLWRNFNPPQTTITEVNLEQTNQRTIPIPLSSWQSTQSLRNCSWSHWNLPGVESEQKNPIFGDTFPRQAKWNSE